MEFLPAVAMMALIVKFVDFLRYARAGDANGVFTQVFVWVAGIAGVLLAAQTDWAEEIMIGDRSLAALGIWSLVFGGLTFGSAGSLIKDTLKSVDSSNSAKIPTLLPTGRAPERTNDDVG
jgi:vacuolar-type H+-ATPase subunit I/STV1